METLLYDDLKFIDYINKKFDSNESLTKDDRKQIQKRNMIILKTDDDKKFIMNSFSEFETSNW